MLLKEDHALSQDDSDGRREDQRVRLCETEKIFAEANDRMRATFGWAWAKRSE